jgi:hypothetical protein
MKMNIEDKDDLTHQSYKTEIVLEIKNNYNQPAKKEVTSQDKSKLVPHVSQLERFLQYPQSGVSEIKIEKQKNETLDTESKLKDIVLPINDYKLNYDENPEFVLKKPKEKVTYKQEVGIRYLRPPSPPPPGDLIIIQEKNIVESPLPPLVIRQQPPRPVTPPPIIVRERPPTPPLPIEEQIIRIPGKKIVLPRKVIVERLAELPQKPPSIIFEKWLPYEKQKRKVIHKIEIPDDEPKPTITQVIKPKNFVSRLQTTTECFERYRSELMSISNHQSQSVSNMKVRQIKDFGVQPCDPLEYIQNNEPLAMSNKTKSYHESISSLKKKDFMESTSSSGIWSPSHYPDDEDDQLGNTTRCSSTKRHSDFTYSFDDHNKHALLMDFFAQYHPKNGKLNLEESDQLYMRAFKRFGHRCTEKEAQEFSDCLNYNNDGYIDFEMFKQEIFNLLN